MSVKTWTCSSRVLHIIVFRAEQVHSSACTSRCDGLGVGQNRVAARHRQVREASSSSFGVGPSGLSLCDECWSFARRFSERDETLRGAGHLLRERGIVGAGAALAAAAWRAAERSSGIFGCSLTFRECVGRSQTMA